MFRENLDEVRDDVVYLGVELQGQVRDFELLLNCLQQLVKVIELNRRKWLVMLNGELAHLNLLNLLFKGNNFGLQLDLVEVLPLLMQFGFELLDLGFELRLDDMKALVDDLQLGFEFILHF